VNIHFACKLSDTRKVKDIPKNTYFIGALPVPDRSEYKMGLFIKNNVGEITEITRGESIGLTFVIHHQADEIKFFQLVNVEVLVTEKT